MNRKVLLIEPQAENDLEPGFFTRGNTLEPYALECLAAVAEASGYPTEILRQGSLTVKDIVQHVMKLNPFCVGLSVLTHTASRAKEIAEAIKASLPTTFIVVGGQHPSLDPTYVHHKCFDYAVLGEGEATFVELLDFLSDNLRITAKNIRGIAFSLFDQGQVVCTSSRPRITNLDTLPLPKRIPQYLRSAHSWNLNYPSPNRQVAVAQISYSRGCRYRCTFCTSPIVWSGTKSDIVSNKVTYRSPELVAREVRTLHEEFGVNYLYFTDLTFNEDVGKLRELCWALINEGLHQGKEFDKSHIENAVHWFALLKVGLDNKTAKLMAQAGCTKIGIGVESFDSKQVQDYKKPYGGTDVLVKSLKAANNAGIIIRCLLMIGSPHDTPSMISKTINQLKRIPVDQVRLAFLTPYPNTPIFSELTDKLLTRNFDFYDEDHPVIKCDDLSSSELYEARLTIARHFYGSHEYYLHCINKLKRFPWLKESYRWFIDDLYNRSAGGIDLRALTQTSSVSFRRYRNEKMVSY